MLLRKMMMENPTKKTKGHDVMEGAISAITKTSPIPLFRSEVDNPQNHHASLLRKDFDHC
jgi:hypothetical protein